MGSIIKQLCEKLSTPITKQNKKCVQILVKNTLTSGVLWKMKQKLYF